MVHKFKYCSQNNSSTNTRLLLQLFVASHKMASIDNYAIAFFCILHFLNAIYNSKTTHAYQSIIWLIPCIPNFQRILCKSTKIHNTSKHFIDMFQTQNEEANRTAGNIYHNRLLYISYISGFSNVHSCCTFISFAISECHIYIYIYIHTYSKMFEVVPSSTEGLISSYVTNITCRFTHGNNSELMLHSYQLQTEFEMKRIKYLACK